MNQYDFDKLREITRNSMSGIINSKVFLQIYTTTIAEDPAAALQLGLAMMLDKPIYLIVLRGAELPKNIEKVAFAIDYIASEADLPEAAKRISEKCKKILLNNMGR